MLPIHIIAVRLRWRYRHNEALVLSDWCHERGLNRWGRILGNIPDSLGSGSWSEIRNAVQTLCDQFDLRSERRAFVRGRFGRFGKSLAEWSGVNSSLPKVVRSVLAFPITTLPPQTETTITVIATLRFRIERVLIPSTIAEDLMIRDIRIGPMSLLTDEVPAAFMAEADLMIGASVQPGQEISIRVWNNAATPIEFSGALVTTQFEDPPQVLGMGSSTGSTGSTGLGGGEFLSFTAPGFRSGFED